MGKVGKRSLSVRDDDGGSKNQRRRVDNDGKGGDELVLYRILCPNWLIGSVIGKGGQVINSIRQETRATIKVVDPFPGAKDRVILIYCHLKEKKEVEVDVDYSNKEPLCPAHDALIKLHAAIAHSVSTIGDEDKKRDDKEECTILAPGSQCSNIIGKSGATIKNLRSKTRAHIRVIAKDVSDPTHSCAMDFDSFVKINGDTESVKKALIAISAIMYKFTPREDIPLDTTVSEAPPSIIIPSDIPVYPPTGFYRRADPVVPSTSVAPVMGAPLPELSHYADTRNTLPVYTSSLPAVLSGASHSEELIVRVLCPSDKIGRVIGKGGSSIKSVRHATGAHIEVNDCKDTGEECLITVISKESDDDLKSMAVEAVLLLQEKINDEDAETVSIRLLAPHKAIGCIIGTGGFIISVIRKRSGADIRISNGEKPKCADANDELVEVCGEVSCVRDALVQIILRLRDNVLKDMDFGHNPSAVTEPVYRTHGALSVPPSLPDISSVPPLVYDQGGGIRTGIGKLYGYGSLPMDDNSYGTLTSYSSNFYGTLPSPLTLEVLIPATAYGKVMGRGGTNLSNIRQISGAIIEISETKTSRGDRVALISGTAEQKRSAENLIQAFIMAT